VFPACPRMFINNSYTPGTFRIATILNRLPSPRGVRIRVRIGIHPSVRFLPGAVVSDPGTVLFGASIAACATCWAGFVSQAVREVRA